MKVYSLTGESGTGKSYNAIAFAHEHNIPAIIDDGLLIYKGKKIAGSSAKFEKTMIAAVKRAIFMDDQHAQHVKDQIEEYNINRILILGTSERMVNRIAERLEISPIDSYWYIEDVLSPDEIKEARNERMTKGRHIIPLSYKELDQNVFQKIIQKGIDIFSSQKEKIGETTIVQPYFHRRLLAKLRREKEKRAKRRIEKLESKTYRTKRRYVYIAPMKEQVANLLPELMNYIVEKLNVLKENLELYYDKTKKAAYDALIKVLGYVRHLISYIVEHFKDRYSSRHYGVIHLKIELADSN